MIENLKTFALAMLFAVMGYVLLVLYLIALG